VAQAAQQLNYHYYALMMMTYYCFIRGTELTKLKVSDVFLDESYVQVDAESSKNRKSESVTIPAPMKIILQNHLRDADRTHYLFSLDNYKPGSVQLTYKRIPDTWRKIRAMTGIGLEYQFYSLKDTGITD